MRSWRSSGAREGSREGSCRRAGGWRRQAALKAKAGNPEEAKGWAHARGSDVSRRGCACNPRSAKGEAQGSPKRQARIKAGTFEEAGAGNTPGALTSAGGAARVTPEVPKRRKQGSRSGQEEGNKEAEVKEAEAREEEAEEEGAKEEGARVEEEEGAEEAEAKKEAEVEEEEAQAAATC